MARRAGVSLRLVFHHFTDMDDLYQFVGALLLRRQWADMPQLSPRLSLPTRIERTSRTGRPSSRRPRTSGAPWSAGRRRRPGVGRRWPPSDNLFLEDLKATFAPELTDLPASSRAEYLGAMDTGTSWEAWDRLRTTSGVPVRGARRVMSLILEALFTGTEAPAPSQPVSPTAVVSRRALGHAPADVVDGGRRVAEDSRPPAEGDLLRARPVLGPDVTGVGQEAEAALAHRVLARPLARPPRRRTR